MLSSRWSVHYIANRSKHGTCREAKRCDNPSADVAYPIYFCRFACIGSYVRVQKTGIRLRTSRTDRTIEKHEAAMDRSDHSLISHVSFSSGRRLSKSFKCSRSIQSTKPLSLNLYVDIDLHTNQRRSTVPGQTIQSVHDRL